MKRFLPLLFLTTALYAAPLPIHSTFNGDPLGGYPTLGGPDQPTYKGFPGCEGLNIERQFNGLYGSKSLAFRWQGPVCQAQYGGSPPTITYDFPPVYSGMLHVEFTVSFNQYIDSDYDYGGMFLSARGGGYGGQSAIQLMILGGQLDGWIDNAVQYEPNVPVRLRVEYDLDDWTWWVVRTDHQEPEKHPIWSYAPEIHQIKFFLGSYPPASMALDDVTIWHTPTK